MTLDLKKTGSKFSVQMHGSIHSQYFVAVVSLLVMEFIGQLFKVNKSLLKDNLKWLLKELHKVKSTNHLIIL